MLVWFQCSPPSALWDPLRQAQCDHGRSVYYTYFVGAVAAISDFYLAIIPITMLIPLRIDKKLKWGLSFLMGCGVFAGAAAIVRTWAAKFIMSADSSCKCLCLYVMSCMTPQPWNTVINILQTVSVFSSAGERSKNGLFSSPCPFHPCGLSSVLSLTDSSNPRTTAASPSTSCITSTVNLPLQLEPLSQSHLRSSPPLSPYRR